MLHDFLVIRVNFPSCSPAVLTCKFISKINPNTIIVSLRVHFLRANFFLRRTVSIIMFHPNYKHIIDRLSKSLFERAFQIFLHNSKDPVPLESISEKSERIESYLRHTLKVYGNSLNSKRKTMTQEKTLRPRSWPECNVFPNISGYICHR